MCVCPVWHCKVWLNVCLSSVMNLLVGLILGGMRLATWNLEHRVEGWPSQRAPLWDPPHLGCLPGMVPDTACRTTGVSPIGLHTSRCYSGRQRLPTRCTEGSHRLSCWSHRSSPKLMCARESTQAFHALTTWNTNSRFSSLRPDKGY